MLLISEIYEVFAFSNTLRSIVFPTHVRTITRQHWIAQRNATSPGTVSGKQLANQPSPQVSNGHDRKPTINVQGSLLKCN